MSDPRSLSMSFVHEVRGVEAVLYAREHKNRDGVRVTVSLRHTEGLPGRKMKGYQVMWHKWLKGAIEGKTEGFAGELPKGWRPRP